MKFIIIALSGVVYKVKSSGPLYEACKIPYGGVTLSDRVSLILKSYLHIFYSSQIDFLYDFSMIIL